MRPTKDEVMAFIKPSPATDGELAGLEKLDDAAEVIRLLG